MDWFVLRKALAALVLPPTGPLFAAIVGLMLLGRRPRIGRVLVWFGVGLLILLSLPIVSHGLLRALDPPPALDLARARQAQAIVILGGGVRPAPEFGGETLSRLSLERVRYGARLARGTKLPVLVSGGTVFGGAAEAPLMKRALEEEFSVSVRWTEERSRDTRSNALESAAVLLPIGVKRIVLVAHGFDFPRASAEFAAAGFQVIPAPTVIAPEHFSYHSAVELLPSMSALNGSYYALYELLANAMRSLRRRSS